MMHRWFTFALCFLVVAASIGVLLRLIYVVELPWLIYRPWLHAHSHVAMLGWAFPGLLIALLGQEEREPPRSFHLWMFASQMMVLGMFVSFPLQGYGPVSITFSSLQIIAGYALVLMAWRGTAHWPADGSRRLARIALIMQPLSTLGAWAIAPIMATGHTGSELYYWSIEFFRHFQFDGWFWFAVMAIGSRWAELHGVRVRLDAATTTLWVVSAVLTFALDIAWSERHPVVFAVNSAGVLLQFWAAWRTLMAMRKARPEALVRTTRWMRAFIGLMLLSMAIKIVVQAAVAVPAVAAMGVTIRNFMIGFIHLNTLGVVSCLLFAHAVMRRWLDERLPLVRVGSVLFMAGIVLTELTLFIQGTMFWAGLGLMPGYYVLLLLFSLLLPLGALLLLMHIILGPQRQREVAPA